ncbi:MAG: type I-F CRISPR-associated endonuclease Cas1f [Proteobacteria bacterium]|jgi:CRISPR-associated protein Cas1|nr:type I-F CRISPR-associated endonuclease Cas1f [Pseudomonadota bacterium]
MKPLPSSEMKAILHSKRANIYYLECCRVMQKDGRVLYLTEAKDANLYWNIPVANTTVILLGNGTSITQAAMRMLAGSGVLVGFCGGGGTPLLMANEVEWLTPQSEYRPTEYLQGWMSFWFDDQKRLTAAKIFQQSRMDYITKVWSNDRDLAEYGFISNESNIKIMLSNYNDRFNHANSVSDLLLNEAQLTKQLYRIATKNCKYGDFTRERESSDKANSFLNHGNYLAYGLAASCLWVIGIPHGLAVMHGKTRRGALVFDVADLIKDALILPLSFICATENATEQEYREQCLQIFVKHKALDYMFDTVKQIALKNDWDIAKL